MLRFLLAVAVIYSHCYVIYYGKAVDTEPFMRFSNNQVDLGSVAVDGFFVISGFLIVRSFQFSASLIDYLQKRVLRIYPGFLVAFTLSMLLLAPLGTIDSAHPQGNFGAYFQNFREKLFVLNLLTLQTQQAPWAFQGNPLPNMANESLWTIQYEFVCYLLVPVLAALGLFKRRWLLLVLFVLAYTLLALQDFAQILLWEGYQGKVLSHPLYLPKFFTYFLAGACFYVYRTQLPRNTGLLLFSAAALVLSCVMLPAFNLVAPLAGSYLLFYLAYFPGIRFPHFTRKGDFSYGLYLYAWPLQQLVMAVGGERLSPGLLFAFSMVFTFMAAYASWHLVEKPFLRLKQYPSSLAVNSLLRLTAVFAKKQR